MNMSYVICEYEKVKSEFPEFKATMDNLKASLLGLAAKDWGLSLAKLSLEQGYVTTVLPALFADNAGNRLTTWEQTFTSTGSQTIMTGVGSGGVIPEDFKVGIAGLAFLDKAIRISEIKMQISDKKLPRINIEEAFVYNKPAIVFEEGYILDEETAFELIGYVLSQGPQRIKLIGLQANRVKDKLLTTNVGAAVE
jgi:hypothetical protein